MRTAKLFNPDLLEQAYNEVSSQDFWQGGDPENEDPQPPPEPTLEQRSQKKRRSAKGAERAKLETTSKGESLDRATPLVDSKDVVPEIPSATFLRPGTIYPMQIYGKPKKKLATALDFTEKERMREMVEREVEKMRTKIEVKYGGNANGSIMLDAKLNNVRNDIMKKIKLAQAKKKNLPNLIRIERETMLEERECPIGEELIESPDTKSASYHRANSLGATKKLTAPAGADE